VRKAVRRKRKGKAARKRKGKAAVPLRQTDCRMEGMLRKKERKREKMASLSATTAEAAAAAATNTGSTRKAVRSRALPAAAQRVRIPPAQAQA
jgi:hypothetical protein